MNPDLIARGFAFKVAQPSPQDILRARHRSFIGAIDSAKFDRADRQVLEILARDGIMCSKKELVNALASLIVMVGEIP